jgi:elongation factor 1-alpha
MKNMISGAAQADVALLMVPADPNFNSAIRKGDIKKSEIQGQTRAHARLLNLLGVKQLLIGVNKMDIASNAMDAADANYGEKRYDEIEKEMKHMLVKVGWDSTFVKSCVPIIPISGWQGDNLITKSEKMPWWKGVSVKNVAGNSVHVHTLLEALNNFCGIPERKTGAPLRVPISGVHQMKNVGNVFTGRVEQGILKPSDEVVFLPTHNVADGVSCQGKVFSVEMHKKSLEQAMPGDAVGMNIKNLDKHSFPRAGDVMIAKSDTSLKPAANFTARIQTLDNIPNEIQRGYSPIGFVRCGRAACKITGINGKIGKETGGSKLESPGCIKANEMAEVVFEPARALVVETFESCEGLARIAFLEGNSPVMLGKIVSVTHK